MDASRRLTNWLRLAAAFVLAVGLSSAAAAATGDGLANRSAPASSHATLDLASLHTTTVHSGAVVRHAAAKHRLPAIAGAVTVVALIFTGLVACAVRRRRTDPALRHHALSGGARAPPVVTGT
jgi:hypothetical protein